MTTKVFAQKSNLEKLHIIDEKENLIAIVYDTRIAFFISDKINKEYKEEPLQLHKFGVKAEDGSLFEL